MLNSKSLINRPILWTFTDGPMEGRTFEHTLQEDGSVAWRALGADGGGKMSTAAKCKVGPVSETVVALSYLGDKGWTLTTILDVAGGTMVSFSSNDKELLMQKGTFVLKDAAARPKATTEARA